MLTEKEKNDLKSCGMQTYIQYYNYFQTLERSALKKKMAHEYQYTMNSINTKISKGIKLTKTKELRKRILEHIINAKKLNTEERVKAQKLLLTECS